MARPKNTAETVQVTVSVTKRIRAYLEILAEEGLSGKSAAETANTLIAERIRELVSSGQLPRPDEVDISD